MVHCPFTFPMENTFNDCSENYFIERLPRLIQYDDHNPNFISSYVQPQSLEGSHDCSYLYIDHLIAKNVLLQNRKANQIRWILQPMCLAKKHTNRLSLLDMTLSTFCAEEQYYSPLLNSFFAHFQTSIYNIQRFDAKPQPNQPNLTVMRLSASIINRFPRELAVLAPICRNFFRLITCFLMLILGINNAFQCISMRKFAIERRAQQWLHNFGNRAPSAHLRHIFNWSNSICNQTRNYAKGNANMGYTGKWQNCIFDGACCEMYCNGITFEFECKLEIRHLIWGIRVEELISFVSDVFVLELGRNEVGNILIGK